MPPGFMQGLGLASQRGWLVSVGYPGGTNRFFVEPCYRRGDRGSSARLRASLYCALGTLAECFQPARLETRTKESNMYASRWVRNPRGARNLTGGSFGAPSTDHDLL